MDCISSLGKTLDEAALRLIPKIEYREKNPKAPYLEVDSQSSS